jgi:membrane protease YdiL (CAAX protease family)
VLWKKSWEPEAVLALIGGIAAAFFVGNLAAMTLRQAGVHGFRGEDSVGSVLLATLSFHGAALVLGAGFLKFHGPSWREVLGSPGWKRSLILAPAVLVAAAPVMLGLVYVSDLGMQKMHWPVEKQAAVKLILNAKSSWLGAYLVFFAAVLAPVAEEFVFAACFFPQPNAGWPKLGWIGVSFCSR